MWVYQRRLYFVKLLICALEVLRPVLLTSNITQTRACFRTFQNNGAFQWWINPKKANLLSFATKNRQMQCMSGAFTNSTWKMRNWNFQGTDWEDGHQYRVFPPSALQGEGGSGGLQVSIFDTLATLCRIKKSSPTSQTKQKLYLNIANRQWLNFIWIATMNRCVHAWFATPVTSRARKKKAATCYCHHCHR